MKIIDIYRWILFGVLSTSVAPAAETSLAKNLGPRAFHARHVVDDNFVSIKQVQAADMDADGDMDVLGINNRYLALWRNTDKSGREWLRSDIEQFRNGSKVESADVDGNGTLDVLAVGEFNQVAWWRNGSGGMDDLTKVVVDEDGSIYALPGDIDGDGDIDIVGTMYSHARVVWWDNLNGDGNFWEENIAVYKDDEFVFKHPQLADIDGDGDIDIVHFKVDSGRSTYWVENVDGVGGIWEERFIGRRGGKSGAAVHPVDLDGDGDIDVLTNDKWWENTAGDGQDWKEIRPEGGFSHNVGIFFDTDDLDGDGDVDIAGNHGNRVTWMENEPNARGGWLDRQVSSVRRHGSDLVLADIDGDQDLDILASFATVSWNGLNMIAWFENVPADTDGRLVSADGVTEQVTLVPTVKDQTNSRQVLDFTVSDGGGGDGRPLKVEWLTVRVGAGWPLDSTVFLLDGPDADGLVGEVDAAFGKVDFKHLDIEIADGDAETYTLSVYMKGDPPAPGARLILSIDGIEDISVGGTQIGGGAVENGAGSEWIEDNNQAPILPILEDRTIAAEQLLEIALPVLDPDGDVVALAFVGAPADARIEGSAFVWTPTAAQAGQYDVVFTAEDSHGARDSKAIRIKVEAIPNRPPLIDPIGDRSVQAGQSLTIQLSASDPDGGPLTFSLTGGSSGSISGTTYQWTPTTAEVGGREVHFVVRDNKGAGNSQTISIIVTPPPLGPNRPPVLNQLGNWSGPEGQPLTYVLLASDPDGDPLTYTVSGNTPGSSFSGNTYRWTPPAGSAGDYPLTFTVSDDKGAIVSQRVTIFVKTLSPPSPPPSPDPSPDLPAPPPPPPEPEEEFELHSPLALLDFGVVQLGEARTLSLPIRNTGPGKAVSRTLNLLGGDRRRFTLSKERFEVAGESEDAVEITFKPIQKGALEVILVISFGAVFYETKLVGQGGLPPPVLEVEAGELDFGEGFVGQGQTRSLWVANNGEGALALSAVTVEGAGFSVEAQTAELATKDTLRLQVTYTRTELGAALGQLVLQTNDPEKPSLALALKGETVLRPPRMVLAAHVLDFGAAAVGTISRQHLKVINAGERDLHLSGWEVSSDQFRAEVADSVVAAGDTVAIELRYLRLRPGTVDASLLLRGDAPDVPVQSVQLLGSASEPPRLVLRPGDELAFKTVDLGEWWTGRVVVRNAGGEVLHDTLGVSGEGFSLESEAVLQVAPGDSAVAVVLFRPEDDGEYNGEVRHRSNDPKIPQKVQTLSGRGRLAVEVEFEFDLDPGPGRQGRAQAVLSDSIEFDLSLYSGPLEGLVGYSVVIEYDPAQIEFVSVVERAPAEGNILEVSGATPLYLQTAEGEGRVGFGGGILSPTPATASSGDGLWGVWRFRTRAGFSTGTSIRLVEVGVRLLEGRGTLRPDIAVELEPAPQVLSPVRLDLNAEEGNQEAQEIELAPGGTGTLEFYLADISRVQGFGLSLAFESEVVALDVGDFSFNEADNSTFFPVTRAVGDDLVDIGAVSLQRDLFAGTYLGRLPFRLAEGFEGETELRLVGVFLQTADQPDLIVRAPQVVTVRAVRSLPGDFNGDQTLDFLDFFALVDQFGRLEPDPRFDMDGDGDVDLEDFFAFTDLFDGSAAAKLLSLAADYLDLGPAVRLKGNHPNPFNAETQIGYVTAVPAEVELRVYDIQGRFVRLLDTGHRPAGRHTVLWDGKDDRGRRVASGVYIYRVRAGRQMRAAKMLLMQ